MLAACAHGVSRANDVPPPHGARLVATTIALREEVDGFRDAWTRRLAILGARAHITYDDNRAVFDLESDRPLDEIAAVLADRGGAWLDDRPVDGTAIAVLPPTASCACSARVRISLDPAWLCRMGDGMHRLARDGRVTPLRGKVRWMQRRSDGVVEIDQPPGMGTCPAPEIYPDSVMFALPPELSPAQQTQVVLALAGGTLPAPVQVRR